jgi:hypothetical protein
MLHFVNCFLRRDTHTYPQSAPAPDAPELQTKRGFLLFLEGALDELFLHGGSSR